MKAPHNIFKNSGIRDITSNTNTAWKHIKELFSKKTSFMTSTNIYYLSYALAIYLEDTYKEPCNILIGTDTRPSGSWIKQYIKNSLLDLKHNVFDGGVVPTPCIAQTVKDYVDSNKKKNFFHLGIMITASHNPALYNGLKIITPTGYLTEDEEIDISNIFHFIIENPQSLLEYASFSRGFNNSLNCAELYISKIKEKIQSFHTAETIVLDCAHGATYDIAPKIFSSYFKKVIPINNSSNGEIINTNSGCSDPALLLSAMQKHDADWGCAFDGDGDRVIIVDKKGNIFNGDDLLMILSKHEQFQQESTFVGTIMTNMATEEHFSSQNKKLLRTDVGERNIIEALHLNHAQLGSEACGHVTIMNHARCSDGIFAALLFFETMYQNTDILENRTMKHHQIHEVIPVKDLQFDDAAIETIVEKQKAIAYPGRIVVRKSNTEPVLRLMVEHKDYDLAQEILTSLKKQLQEYLSCKE